jgi:hypothetical protein
MPKLSPRIAVVPETKLLPMPLAVITPSHVKVGVVILRFKILRAGTASVPTVIVAGFAKSK